MGVCGVEALVVGILDTPRLIPSIPAYTATKQATIGFPRKIDQADFFESKLYPLSLVLFLDCSQETLQHFKIYNKI